MDQKPVKMTTGCGICYTNMRTTKHTYYITEALKQENPRIHSGYTQGYLKIMLHYDFRVYSVSSRNESSGIFLEVKHGW
jgi:hypothetical protein